MLSTLSSEQKFTIAHPVRASLALNSLRSALDDLGRVDEAIDIYGKALDINPRLSAAHNNLAVALAKKGQIDNTIIETESVLQIESGNATYHYNYAMLLSHTGDTEKARKHLKLHNLSTLRTWVPARHCKVLESNN